MPFLHYPRFPLAFLPTPIEELKNLSQFLGGPRILIKRDDQTGLAFGGNKTRKLEFLVGDALTQEVDTLVTMGSIQSNHCRQTAAAAAKAGLQCELLLQGEPPTESNGNLLIDQLLGAKIHWTDQPTSNETLAALIPEVKARGYKPYMIPYGGSNALGALGYVNAMLECDEQLKAMKESVDYIVVASSSGGTQAGLEVGARLVNFNGKIQGIGISKAENLNSSLEKDFMKIANDAAKWIHLDTYFTEKDFSINHGYLGAGYAVMGALEKEAITLMACHEGILLDPVYTGRAFGGLIDLIRQGQFLSDQTILFWHTGGMPALFAYADVFKKAY